MINPNTFKDAIETPISTTYSYSVGPYPVYENMTTIEIQNLYGRAVSKAIDEVNTEFPLHIPKFQKPSVRTGNTLVGHDIKAEMRFSLERNRDVVYFRFTIIPVPMYLNYKVKKRFYGSPSSVIVSK